MDRDNAKYYKIDISQRPEGVDLSLSALSSSGKETAPKLYVSRRDENQFPKSADAADYMSTVNKGNIIFVSAADLDGVQNIYVGIYCSVTKCEPNVNFEYTKEISAVADGTKIVETAATLRGASSAVVRLNVPSSPNPERIVIHIDAIPTTNDVIHPELTVFINTGNNIPFTNHAENIPRSSWFEGKTIVIYKDTEQFCTDCSYTLSLKFDPYSSISFEAHVFEADTYLEGKTMLDGISKIRPNTYTFQVEEERKEEDLVIDIKPQGGSATLYINCDLRPSDFNKYYWRYSITKNTEVVLTKKEHQKCTTGSYYVLVSSKESTVYSIRLTTKSASQLFIGKDSPITGDIFPDETITYEVFVPLFSVEQIIFDLTSNPALNLSLLNCRFPTDCPGLLPAGIEFRHQISSDSSGTYEPPEFKYDIETLPEGQKITINPHEEGCYPIIIQDNMFMKDPMPVCAYRVTLYSNNPSPVEYTLKALSQGHEWLFIGGPKYASVLENEISYFVLNVPHEDVATISIQLTTFSGDVDIFVSKTEKFPFRENDQTQFSHEGLLIFQRQPNQTDQPELNGTYYIGVHGLETSSFSLSATVLTAGNKTEDYAQTLVEGKPQKGVLLPKHEHPARFYKFTVDLDPEWEGTINIAVNTLRGSVLVAANEGDTVPLPNFHMWNSSQEIVISSEDEHFDLEGTYYIGVFVDWSVLQPDVEDITFNIVYYLKENSASTDTQGGQVVPVSQMNYQHFFLSPLTPFHRTLKKTDRDYYEAFILPKDTGITIYKEADAGDVDLYISLDSENEYPDETKFTYTTKTTYKDYIELNQEDLTKACAGEGIRLCTFFIAVVPKGDSESVAYSLSMKRDYARATETVTGTPLEDGRLRKFNVPEAGKPSYFYFYTSPFNPSIITVSCAGEDVIIYANKTKTAIGTSAKPVFNAPTIESYDFVSDQSVNGAAHLTVPAQFTVDSYIVSLAVYFKHSDKQDVDPSTTFTILISSQMTHIFTGKQYYGAVEEDSYMYFYLNVFKPESTLLISMTTLNDGDPDLVVSTSRADPPTIEFHDFASISHQRTELLEINKLDIYPKTSMEGTWVIGVYGRTNSTFSLTVLDEDQKMVQLKADTPFEMYMRESSQMYFKYYHGKSDDVEIRIDQLSGDVVANVATVSGGEEEPDFAANFANLTNYKWQIRPDMDSVLSIPADDSKACTECLYLIALEASSASKLSITVTEGQRFIKLQNGLTYTNQLKAGSSKTYLFSSTNSEEVVLSIALKGANLNVYASSSSDMTEENSIRKVTLTSDDSRKILSLIKSEFQFANSYYIKFENPTDELVSYTFSATSRDSSPILKQGSKHMFTLEREEATSLVYYSSEDDQIIKLNVEFTVKSDPEGDEKEFERNLRTGIPVKAYYWTEKATSGPGKVVSVIKDHVMRDSTRNTGSGTTYVIREGFTIDGRKGKYGFDIENPFWTTIEVRATAYSSEFGSLTLEQNAQHSSTLTQDVSETYEVYLSGGGAWYLWAYSCTGKVDFSVADNPEGLTNSQQSLSAGNDYLHRAATGATTTKYARLANTRGDESQFVVSSKFFPGERQSDYFSTPAQVQVSSVFQGYNSSLTANVQPAKITGYESDDDIVYHVRVCPVRPTEPESANNLCNIQDDCKSFQQQFKISSQANVQAAFSRLQPGNYYVHVTADIHHNGQFIKFVPYPSQTVAISEPITEKVTGGSFGIVLLVLLGLVILGLVCYKFYGKFRQFSEDKGFELPTVGKRKGYGFLGDDL